MRLDVGGQRRERRLREVPPVRPVPAREPWERPSGQPWEPPSALELARFLARQEPHALAAARGLLFDDGRGERRARMLLEAWHCGGHVSRGSAMAVGTQGASAWAPLLTDAALVGRSAGALRPQAAAAPSGGLAADLTTPRLGVLAIKVAVPGACVPFSALEAAGLARSSPGQRAVACWDVNEDAVSLALTACARLLADMSPEQRARVARLEYGGESNVDMAKGIKTYLMQLFPEQPELGGVDNVAACFGGTAAVLNTLDFLRASAARGAPGRLGIVVVSDVANMDRRRLGLQGAGAVAMLLGQSDGGVAPPVEILPDPVHFMANTDFFLKPRYSSGIAPHMQGAQSLDAYLTALRHVARRTAERFGDEWSLPGVENVVVHGGLARSVVSSALEAWRQLDGHQLSKPEAERRAALAAQNGEDLGGLYAASAWVSLHSLLEHGGAPVGRGLLFSYGSGCASAMLRFVVHGRPAGFEAMGPALAARAVLSADEVLEMQARHEACHEGRPGQLPSGTRRFEDPGRPRYWLSAFPAEGRMRQYEI